MSTYPHDGGAQATAEAIAALTAAAKATYTTRDGGEDRYDFGETAGHVLAAVAANLGGVEPLLAGRPGSWEADHVRQMVHATAGYDERYLFEHRIEPIRLVLDAGGVFADFGLEEMMDAELGPLYDVPADDPRSDDEIERDGELGDAIQELHEADQVAYLAAYTQTVQLVAAELGITVPVEVKRVTSPDQREPAWDILAEQLHDAARDRTPVPATLQAPRDHGGLPAEVARAAGRTYRARVDELQAVQA